MSYVTNLRPLVGHRPLIVCVCGCLIFNQKGQVLLQQRSDDGLWGNPGGSMELGETIYETVIREVKEETNLEINAQDLTLFKIYSGPDQHHFYPGGDEVYFVNITFKVTQYQGEIRPDSESRALRFFDLDQLPAAQTPPFRCVAKDLQALISTQNP